MFHIGIRSLFLALISVVSLQSSCVSNTQTECNPTCKSDEECVNGACQKKQTGCNPACGTDEECINYCLGASQAGNGICSRLCMTDPSACNQMRDGKSMSCARIYKEGSACIFACNERADCPSGTVYVEGTICLPPS